MELLLFYLFLALIVSFLCSIAEAVLLSTPISFLKIREGSGNKSAIGFIKFKKEIDKPLSAILSLNTVAHTVGAAGVGAQANIVFGDAYFGIVSAVLTILILVLTEIIPKTLGAKFYKPLSAFAYYLIKVMIFISYPLVYISSLITGLLSNSNNEKTVSREEIAILASIGTAEGTFLDRENNIIQNLMNLNNITIEEIMTPRVVVSSANEKMTIGEFRERINEFKHSRIPIYEEKDDHITGYILRQTALEYIADNKLDAALKDIKRDAMITSEKAKVFTLWKQLVENKEHIAIAINEWGGFDGIITMEDIIETLLGMEIIDEKDTIADMQEYARISKDRRLKKQANAKYK